VLDRGEKLDDLVGKSEELSLHSKAFYTTVGDCRPLSLHSTVTVNPPVNCALEILLLIYLLNYFSIVVIVLSFSLLTIGSRAFRVALKCTA